MNNQSLSFKNSFGPALHAARSMACVTQEAFGGVSSRTYVSTLERGLKSPTLSKVDDLSSAMGIHPLALLTLSYCERLSIDDARKLLKKVEVDLTRLMLVGPTRG